MVFNVVALVAIENAAKVAAASMASAAVIYGLIPSSSIATKGGGPQIQGVFSSSKCVIT